MFHDPAFGLGEAHAVLSGQGLTVACQDGLLTVQWQGGPLLRVNLARGQDVQKEIERLAKGTRYASETSHFDAKFEITPDDMDEVLDDVNTLIEVQLTLQAVTQGFLYNTRGKRFFRPEK